MHNKAKAEEYFLTFALCDKDVANILIFLPVKAGRKGGCHRIGDGGEYSVESGTGYGDFGPKGPGEK